MKFERILIILSIFVLLFVGFFHPVYAITQDLGRHFLLGEIILKTHQVPLTNLFSYTYPDFPFINLHWLPEVIFYIIFKLFNFNGLLIFSTLIILLTFFIISYKVFKTSPLLSVTIGSTLYLRILFERTDIRPEIFSFLFLSIFIIVLYSFRQKFTRWIFILPIIELLWVNTHVYFFIGLVVIGLFLIDSLARRFKRGEDTKFFSFASWRASLTLWSLPKLLREDNRGTKKFSCPTSALLLIILVFSYVATLINPNGLTGALYPFHIFDNYGYTIEENQNIFFLWQYSQKPTIIFFVLSSTLLFLSLLLTIKKTKLIDWLLSIFFTAFAIFAIRNFPLFVFATFIPFIKSFSNITEKITFINKKIIVVFLFVILFWQIIEVSQIKGFGFGVETGAKNAADFFLENNLKGPIFNNFDIGGYLDYRLYPKERVFVDNRPGEYPAVFFQKTYIPMQTDTKIFEEIDKKHNFNSIIFGYSDQTYWGKAFIKQIVNNPGWKIVYFDDFTIIFVKNNKQNKNIIDKFGMDKDTLKISYFDEKKYVSLLRLAVFFNIVEWREREVKTYHKILAIKPNLCPILYNLYLISAEQNDPAAGIWGSKYQNKCQ